MFGPSTPCVGLNLRCQVCQEPHEALCGGKEPGFAANFASEIIQRFEEEHRHCWENHPTLRKEMVYTAGKNTQLLHAYQPCSQCDLPKNRKYMTRLAISEFPFKCHCLTHQKWYIDFLERDKYVFLNLGFKVIDIHCHVVNIGRSIGVIGKLEMYEEMVVKEDTSLSQDYLSSSVFCSLSPEHAEILKDHLRPSVEFPELFRWKKCRVLKSDLRERSKKLWNSG